MEVIIRSSFPILLTFCLWGIALSAYTSPSKNATFTLDWNIILNPNITTPVISPASAVDYPLSQAGWTTTVTFVQYIDLCLLKAGNMLACPTYAGVTCGWQFLDTDSYFKNQVYYQAFNLTAGDEYMIKLDWISEVSYIATSTGITVTWNGVTIDSFFDNSCTLRTSTYYVTSVAGQNKLAFGGMGLMDSQGILIRNIRLQKMIYSVSTLPTTNSTAANSTTTNSTVTNISLTNNITNGQTTSNLTTNLANSSTTTQNTSIVNGTTSSPALATNKSIISTDNSIIDNTATQSSTNIVPQVNMTTDVPPANNMVINNDPSTANINLSSNTTNITSNSTIIDNNTNTNPSPTPIENTTNIQISNITNSTNSSTSNTNTDNTTTTTNSSNSTDNSTSSTSDDTYNSYNTDTTSSSISFSDLQNIFNSTEYKKLFKMMNFLKDYSLFQVSNTIISARQNMKFLLGFMLQFNHFLLYNFHIINYTLMSNIILSGMQAMDDQKGQFVDQYVYPLFSTSSAQIAQGFQQQNNLPVNMNNLVTDFAKRPNSILLELSDACLLDLPVTLLIFLVGVIVFKLLFRFRISMLFRQYSLFGYVFCVFLDGKVEIMTFYFLSEALLLVSSSFMQKIKVIVIIFAYFLIFTFAVGSMFLFKVIYGKLLKYIYENCRNPLSSSLQMSISFGFFNIFLGFIHRIMLPFPLLQIYLLLAVEISYLILMIRLICQHFYQNSLLAFTLCLMNLSRIILVSSFVVYEFWPDGEYLISKVQEYTFYCFLVLWVCSSFVSFLEKLYIIYKIVSYQCKECNNKITSSNKVTPFCSAESSCKPTKKTDADLEKYSVNIQQQTDISRRIKRKANPLFQIDCPIKKIKQAPKIQQCSQSISIMTTTRRKKTNRMVTKLKFAIE